MWDFKVFPKEQELLEKLGKYSFIAGLVLSIVGIFAIIYPMYASLFTVAFIAWIMVFSGISVGYFNHTQPNSILPILVSKESCRFCKRFVKSY